MQEIDYKEVWVENPQYRIIPTRFPPINFFERFTPPDLMEEAFELESMTNDRLRQETGELSLVRPQDRLSGPGASVVMAAFTHIGNPSRFTDGGFGIYYAGLSQETSVRETVFHRERFLSATGEPPCDIDMRVYKGTVEKPMLDIRGDEFRNLMNPDPNQYHASQAFGEKIRGKDYWGLLYPSVRNPGSDCIAAFRPPAVSLPVQSKLLAYHWNGERIATVYEKTQLLIDLR